MRTLVNREHAAVVGFLDEIAAQIVIAHASTNRAADGRADLAHIELDFAHSALAEIADITTVLTGYLNRLIPSTANAKQASSGHGLIPPTRNVYTIPDDDDDDDAYTAPTPAEPEGVVAA